MLWRHAITTPATNSFDKFELGLIRLRGTEEALPLLFVDRSWLDGAVVSRPFRQSVHYFL
jgi:hypothetical protein